MDEGIELAAIPLAQDVRYPELQDVYAMESWFVEAKAATAKHLAEQTATYSANWSSSISKARAAKCLGISTETIDRYLVSHPDAVRKGTRQTWQFDRKHAIFSRLP
jgi:hypothetical protein